MERERETSEQRKERKKRKEIVAILMHAFFFPYFISKVFIQYDIVVALGSQKFCFKFTLFYTRERTLYIYYTNFFFVFFFILKEERKPRMRTTI